MNRGWTGLGRSWQIRSLRLHHKSTTPWLSVFPVVEPGDQIVGIGVVTRRRTTTLLWARLGIRREKATA